ncbi:hypothetical protein BDF14DRAFT_1861110 [Spinellus fusiger]|nr:hypothetical protein BDF14DRAFT_1861110 [Spinellus fusiger]
MASQPDYRHSLTPRAVKVYSIAQESRHLVLINVPSLGLSGEVLTLCSNYGTVEEVLMMDHHEHATEFTDVFYVRMDSVVSARRLKKSIDDKPFYANLLTIAYAPDYETVHDARLKLQQRKDTLHCFFTPKPHVTKTLPAPPNYKALEISNTQQQQAVWRAHPLHEPNPQVTMEIQCRTRTRTPTAPAPLKPVTQRRRI